MYMKHKKVKVGKKSIDAFCIRLLDKNFVLLKGSKGYVMCGYLNLKTAEKFHDVAVKIIGVSAIEDALKARVHSCSFAAKKLGISLGQKVSKALRIIA
jgi:uncharacterized protein YunC (DUF1805 family)